MTGSQLESDLLALGAEELKEKGYSVVLEPSPSSLPGPLRELRPDAIAIGKQPLLVIAVAKEGEGASLRIRSLRDAIDGLAEWRLHLILDSSRSPRELHAPGLEQFQATVDKAADVATATPMAALLLCWASLEALARKIEPTTFARAQTPGRIIERLAAMGYIVDSEARFLREMATRRNAFIHGDLSVTSSGADIAEFVGLLRSLLDAAWPGGLT